MANDVVYPPEIVDTPLPNQSDQAVTTTQGVTTQAGVGSVPTVSDSPLPKLTYVGETVSESLNTKSKKIIGGYSFTPSGAIQIGDYVPGLSGDIRITPTGITARDLAGNTTLAIDGDTGNAVFKGEVQEGATVTGGVEILDGGSILLYDSNNVPSIFIGQSN